MAWKLYRNLKSILDIESWLLLINHSSECDDASFSVRAKMNWNTKAKTRAGRGKSRENIECQQRLAAWNKLPKKRGTSTNPGTNSSSITSRSRVSNDVSQHRADQLLSNDLMMLQGLQPKEMPQQQHTPDRTMRNSSPGEQSRKRKFEDPLGLLEFTVFVWGVTVLAFWNPYWLQLFLAWKRQKTSHRVKWTRANYTRVWWLPRRRHTTYS
jgi:hypothetical protein